MDVYTISKIKFLLLCSILLTACHPTGKLAIYNINDKDAILTYQSFCDYLLEPDMRFSGECLRDTIIIPAGQGLIIGQGLLLLNINTLNYKDPEVWVEETLKWSIPKGINKFTFAENTHEPLFYTNWELLIEKYKNLQFIGDEKINKKRMRYYGYILIE